MVVSGKVEYVVGRWPGQQYSGKIDVSVNAAEGDNVFELLAEQAKQEVSRKLCTLTTNITIKSVILR